MSAFDPHRLVADVNVRLHQLGVATLTPGVAADQAAAVLLVALGVTPVDEHRVVRYRTRLLVLRQQGESADELAAEEFAYKLRSLPVVRRGRATVVVEAILAPILAVTP